MVNSRHSANRALCYEGLDGDIHHQVEALGGHITQADKGTYLC